MLGCISSGSSPAPSAGVEAAGVVWNGLAAKHASETKKPVHRQQHRRRVGRDVTQPARVRYSASVDHNDESVTHSSSEPCCEDHGAVSL